MPYQLIQLPTNSEKSDLNDIPSLLVFTIADEKQGTIGRHSTCDFRIKSDELPCFVSRKHAHIGIKDGCLLVQDLSSANGTYVNNIMLKPYCETAVKAGDCVAFGCRTEKVTPGLKANEKDMPFRFKIHEVKVTAVRPTIFAKMKKDEMKKSARNNSTKSASTSSMQGTNGQTKKTDEPDSGFDDQELNLPKKRRMSNDSEVTMKFSSKLNKANKSNPKPLPVEEVDSEESVSEPESPPRKTKNKSNAKKRTVSVSKSEETDEDDRSDDCQSYECLFRQTKTKKPKVVSWVQCDSCDRWFHTVCVGCDYNKVKLSSHQFHCGLC